MKLVAVLGLCLLVCYIHATSSDPPKAKKSTEKVADAKKARDNVGTTKEKNKKPVKDKPARDGVKAKRTPQIRTPFDKVLDKLSKCAASSTLSPSLVEVMETNLQELQSDEKYKSLFNAAPHTTAFLKKKKKDSTKFIGGLQQALMAADWSSPVWKSADEIDTLFRPFKQQFVYTMMRFNCTA